MKQIMINTQVKATDWKPVTGGKENTVAFGTKQQCQRNKKSLLRLVVF